MYGTNNMTRNFGIWQAKTFGAKIPFGQKMTQPTWYFSGTVHNTDTSPVWLYTSTYMVYILYPNRHPKRDHSSNMSTFIKFGHALVVVLRTGWSRFWYPFFKGANIFSVIWLTFYYFFLLCKYIWTLVTLFCAHFL